MPLSFNESTATGVTTAGSALGTDFPVYFPYLAKAHVNSDFNKVLQPQANFVVYDANEAVAPAGAFGTSTAFIRYTTGFPAAGVTVRVRRTTEKAFPLVDFQDGSALTADDQDLSFLQNFYLNQESVEQADNALGKVGLVFYANGVRITEIGQPTQANDATTKLYVDTQAALKVTKAGDTMSGALAMGNNKITGLGTPTANADAATKLYVDTADSTLTSSKVTKAGDTMTGALAMSNNKITGLGTPTVATDASTKAYVDAGDALDVKKSGDSMTGALAMGANKITGLGTPTADTDAATKAYADTKLSLSGGTMAGAIDFSGFPLSDIGTPVSFSDATTKSYVDASIQQYITTGGVSGNPLRWLFTGNGSTLVFNITGATALYTTSYLVTIDGVVQDPTFSYNIVISGTPTLTFDQAPPSGTRIVVIALGYAQPTISAIPNNTVGTGALVNDSVTSDKLADSASIDANRAVTTNHIRDLNVTTAKLADDSVTSAKLVDDASVDANRAVTTNHIRDLAVTTAKIAANAVTDVKLSSDASVDANRAVNTNHIKDLAVSTAKVAANAITDAKLSSSPTVDASRAVTTNHIRDLAVTDAKLAGSITAAKLATQAGLVAAQYGSTTQVSQVTVNAQGLVTAIASQNIAFPTQRVLNVYSVIKRDTFANGSAWQYQSITGLQIGTLNTAPYSGGRLTLTTATNRVLIQGTVHIADNNNYSASLQLMRWQTGIAPIAATAMVAANYYMIVTQGTTTFTSFGARANSVGTYFRATAAGTGTGTVLPVTMVGMGDQNLIRTRVTAAYISNLNGYSMFPIPLNLMDAPGFTNVSYDLLIGTHGTGTSYVNRNHLWQNPAGALSGSNSLSYDPLPSSSLIFTELTT
jgi:hypothetical protein